MTSPTPVLAGYFTWQALDALAASAWRAVEAVFRLAVVWPGRADWKVALTDSIVRQIVLAEVTGRYAGVPARPVDGNPVMPTDDVPRRRPDREWQQLADEAPPLTAEERANPYDVPLRDDELTERIGKAVDTLVDEKMPDWTEEPSEEARQIVASALQELAERVERLARDETVQGAQRGYQDGLRAAPSGRVVGYRRGINPDCCELCFWLWKEGYVYPINQPMHRHTGCRCVPVPTSDPVGRSTLSDEEQSLLDTLYDKYSLGISPEETDQSGAGNA